MTRQEAEIEPPVRQLRRWLAGEVAALQRDYLRDSSAAVARLARLRTPANAAAEGWEILGGLPATLVGQTDRMSRGEQAAYDALQLFAIHQQSRRDLGMHQSGVRLGQALRSLRSRAASEDGVVRRFKELGAAASYDRSVRILRGLVTQLRATQTGVDYGAVVADLWDLQDPALRSGVRLRWARDFHRRPESKDPHSPSAPAPPEPAADDDTRNEQGEFA